MYTKDQTVQRITGKLPTVCVTVGLAMYTKDQTVQRTTGKLPTVFVTVGSAMYVKDQSLWIKVCSENN